MIIAAFDVFYLKDGRASAAAVLFSEYSDSEPFVVYTQFQPEVAEYIPGEFYRRELPCILSLMKQINEPVDEMVVDGYVMLGNKYGLGYYLYSAFDGKIPVVGVAKSRFKDAMAAEVFRGKSMRPLYVTSAGIELHEAVDRIKTMYGPHRIPALLKQVDLLARKTTR